MTTQPTQSQELGALAAALCKAQAVMEGAKQDSSNPFFKSKYADLASVWAACKAPLAANGLSVVQTVENGGDKAYLVTTLLHSSGQWMKSFMPILMKNHDAQGLGSAITYCRRYALAAIVGVCPTDDDGEGAVGRAAPARVTTISKTQIETIEKLIDTRKDILERLLDWAGIDHVKDLSVEDYSAAVINIKNALKPGASA